MSDSFQRKQDHIDLCNSGDVGFKSHQGLFDEVTLIHNALPELAMSDISLETSLLDSTLKAPVMVTGMTGGPERAGTINRDIAQICESMGLAFGVGSQRVLLRAPDALDTFNVRQSAPNIVLFGNIGVNQARNHGIDMVKALMDRIEANYMAIHLNPAMELAQPGAEADSDFTAGYDTIARLVDRLDGRVLVKECGTGLSPMVVKRLESIGVRAVDVSGSGGTSWVKVEALRAQGALASLGETFAEWGIPTIPATAMARRASTMSIVASGGIDDGLKAGKALAMGADIVGMARPLLQAYMKGGKDAAVQWLEVFIGGIRTTLALTGSRTVKELRRAPRMIGADLERWLSASTNSNQDSSNPGLSFDALALQRTNTIQTLLRDVAQDDLVMALKSAEPQLSAKIYESVSRRTAELLKEDMESLGPVPKRLVLAARERISDTMIQLEETQGVIFVREEDDLVD